MDFEGNQLCGTKKRTSEILMHLQMMKKPAQGRRHLPLPSALRHGVRGRGHRAADVHVAGI